MPCCITDVFPKFLGADGPDDTTVGPGPKIPIPVLRQRGKERIRNTNRVVAILSGNRGVGFAFVVGRISCSNQSRYLLFFLRFLPENKGFDFGVIDIRQTIFAARRVVPPDLIAPAARSPILRNDINPEE